MDPKKKFSQNFLDKIMQLETSGGKFMEHEPADPKSMHLGTTAMGRYGLMPLTVSDIVKENPNPDFNELKQYTDFTNVGNPEVSLAKQDALKQYLKSNPMVEDQVAKALQNKIENQMQGNEALGAVAWHAGSNASPELLKKFLREKGQRGKDSRTYLKRWDKLKSVQSDVPTLQQESVSHTGPSLLGVMSQRPTVEKLMDQAAQEELDTGLWSQLKQYLTQYYGDGNEE
jgi:hypothetical protein